jgi:hypothetical protein
MRLSPAAIALCTATWLWIPIGSLGCSHNDELAFDDVDVVGRDSNPDAVAYPTDDLGGRARSGSTPGNRIPNFTFRGYPNSERSSGLKVVSLADYFDPEQRRNKVLHIVAAVAWCPHCAAQTQAMVAATAQLRAAGAESVQTLMQAPDPDRGLRLTDLDDWVDRFQTQFTVVLDVEGRRLSSIADMGSVPWNALIDTRTMEILSVTSGVPGDFSAYVQTALDWVASHPPRP